MNTRPPGRLAIAIAQLNPAVGDISGNADMARTARKQAISALTTMMGTLVLSRIAGNGEFSDEILAAGREAVLGRAAAAKPAAKKVKPN